MQFRATPAPSMVMAPLSRSALTFASSLWACCWHRSGGCSHRREDSALTHANRRTAQKGLFLVIWLHNLHSFLLLPKGPQVAAQFLLKSCHCQNLRFFGV